jgi:ParB/RepB/Spo0J family partition protein
MLCGRDAGQVVSGHFIANGRTRKPHIRNGSSYCGECGGSMYAEALDGHVAEGAPRGPSPNRAPVVARDGGPGYDSGLPSAIHTRVALVPISAIAHTPEGRSSRVRQDGAGLDELAASIQRHGVLQPIIVRPLTDGEGIDSTTAMRDVPNPPFVVIAGNRRLQAARRLGHEAVPCIIRAADTDEAFILNVVENLQRQELSGHERVRALILLAALTDEQGRPLGVREISRRTGLALGTISSWLRIDRSPTLRTALEDERLDIGRAMALVSVPEASLPELVARAGSLSQKDLAAQARAVTRMADSVGLAPASADERRALQAYEALLLVEHVTEPVRQVLETVQERIVELLAR